MNIKKSTYLLGLCTLVGALGTGCQSKDEHQRTNQHVVVPAIDTTAMDLSVNPRTDFYRYANGGWMTNNPLKDEDSRYGAFDILRDSSLHIVHQILQDELANTEAGSDQEKAKVLYDMVMDSVKLNADGAKPVQPILQRIDALTTKEDFVQFLAERANEGASHFVITYVSADEKKSDTNILNLCQPGLLMGDKDYYSTGMDFAHHQASYLEYVSKLFLLAGIPEEKINNLATECYETERSLSHLLYSREEMRDTEKNYNKLDTVRLFQQFSFPYKAYFNARTGLAGQFGELNVNQIEFTKKFDTWYAHTPLEKLKTLLKAYTLNEAAPYLSDDFRKTSFDFHGKVMRGAKEMRPRWKSAVSAVDDHLGEIVGKIYVEKHFPPAAKERMKQLIENLKTALGERIKTLDWMSEETKEKAQEKLSTFMVKIGYPDKWQDFSKLEIVRTSLYDYMQSISRFEVQKNVADLHKPVDRTRWFMNPHTVNAYYNPTTNEICFPAGILQPPFFNRDADDAVNYGAIGVVIGHEMTHGFDDQGRRYDKDGNMTNWWTEDDAKKFEKSAEKLSKQFDQITVAEGLKANGRLTLGENIADQGGLLVAYQALQKALEGKEKSKIEGWTPFQRFFIAYARIWGQNIRPEEIVRLTKIDPHSLGEWRVNQTLKNIPGFYDAFGVQQGDSMYLAPEDRVLVW